MMRRWIAGALVEPQQTYVAVDPLHCDAAHVADLRENVGEHIVGDVGVSGVHLVRSRRSKKAEAVVTTPEDLYLLMNPSNGRIYVDAKPSRICAASALGVPKTVNPVMSTHC